MLVEWGVGVAVFLIVAYFLGCLGCSSNSQSIHIDPMGNLTMKWNTGSLRWKYGADKPFIKGHAKISISGNMAHITTGSVFQSQSCNYQFKP
jgi:hypothetical protein